MHILIYSISTATVTCTVYNIIIAFITNYLPFPVRNLPIIDMAKEHSFYSAPFPRDVSNLYIRSVGHSVWAADSRLVRKGWSYYQLLFHTAGAAIGTVDGQKIYAEKNGAWILPKDKTYSYSWDPEIKNISYWAH